MSVTLKQIADRAKVSHGAVSAVLNRRAGNIRVAPATRQRILRIAEQMDYRPNSLARGLRGSKTRSVGLIWPFVDEWTGDTSIALDILRSMQGHGYATYHADTRWSLEHTQQVIDDLAQRRIDALVIRVATTFLSDPSIIKRLNALPAVLAITPVPIEQLQCDQLVHDRFAGIHQVADYFAASGRRRPAMGEAQSDPDNRTKYQAFRDRLAELGIPEHEHMLIDFGKPSRPQHLMVERAMDKYFGGNVDIDAIFCPNDINAMAAARYVKRAGRRVPEDVAIVGMNNTEPGMLWDPPLASIDRQREQVRQAAEELILQRMNEPHLPRQTRTVSMPFIWRPSAGPRPADTVESL